MEQTERIRLVFAASADEDSRDRPIHALRAGTFADSYGRGSTFEPRHLRQMAERLNAGAAKRRPPINEGHDYGRAVGRMLEAQCRNRGNDLYITPRWNTQGRQLLTDEVYDAFSIELERGADGEYTIIGGALTNYPAVNGLAPLSLSSAAPDDVAVIHLPPFEIQEDNMIEEQAAPVAPAPAPAPTMPAPPALNLSDPAVRAQFEYTSSEMQAMYQQQYALAQDAARQQARAEFERWRAEEGIRSAAMAFAQHATTPTLQRPTTISYSAEQILDLITTPTGDKVRKLFEDALSGTLLISSSTIGSSRGDSEAGEAAQFDALVFERVRGGMAQTDAIKAVAKAHPALYAAQSRPKGGR